MDKPDYVNQMNELLNDTSTYRKIKKDPINTLTSKINSLVKSWHDNDIIDTQTYRSLNCTNGNLPRCYGLPKIHKNGYPLRIIVSTLGSPLYNIARFLHDILHHSVHKPMSHVKDSWSFVQKISNTTIRPDELLVSLDVTSLFTNIPKELVIKAIEKRWTEISTNTALNLPQFIYAIELVLNSTSFKFDGQHYEQIFGSPIGSPLSPILADLVMDDLETECLKKLDFEILIFCRITTIDPVFRR
ncbi:PREDICTED: uncharacterized protein LOC105556755 [Vollenhovia emeryi]|uniref:uncharacterized protein LOC105556755 n=1 Tax=Vollenhovia emeryi TaxID=411798 RepID=UPI0005F55A63|nr:PREDICTED: uncharacterized protein LOC105556755 [Vollenhovia emeryi]